MGREMTGLVLRIAGGGNQAFDRLMEYYYPGILRVAYLISGNHVDSEGIVQETFALYWMNRKKIKEPKYLKNWLYRTLTRKVWRYCRKNKREQPMKEMSGKEEPKAASMLEEVMMRSRKKEFYRAIGNLPMGQKTVVVLCYFSQMSAREIADIMGYLKGTVKSRLSTTRANLKQELIEGSRRIGREVIL